MEKVYVVNEEQHKSLLSLIETKQSKNYLLTCLLIKIFNILCTIGLFIFIVNGILNYLNLNIITYMIGCIGIYLLLIGICFFIKTFLRNTILCNYIYIGNRIYTLTDTELEITNGIKEQTIRIKYNDINELELCKTDGLLKICKYISKDELLTQNWDKVYEIDERMKAYYLIPSSLDNFKQFTELLKEKTELNINGKFDEDDI